MTSVVFLLAGQAVLAQSPKMKMTTEIPASITTPDPIQQEKFNGYTALRPVIPDTSEESQK